VGVCYFFFSGFLRAFLVIFSPLPSTEEVTRARKST
jgi:hypothetical protein